MRQGLLQTSRALSAGTASAGPQVDTLTEPRLILLHRDRIEDRKTWSGIPHLMHRSLRDSGACVALCDGFGYPRGFGISTTNQILGLIGSSPYHRWSTPRYYERRISQRLSQSPERAGVHVFIDFYMPLACYAPGIKTLYTSDCNKSQLIEMKYPGFDRIPEATAARMRAIEEAAYARADVLVFPTRWAADSTIERYGVLPEKVHVVPYGANLDRIPERGEACNDGPWNATDRCELLFLGVDWARKGGELALETTRLLNRAGLRARLTVCGTVPPHEESESLQVIPFLDKRTPRDMLRLEELLLRSTFLLLPSRAECYGIVFCEAAAYGLPSVALRRGGPAEIIVDGETGFLLDPEAGASDYAERILTSFADRASYVELRRRSRERYEARLNWERWARTICTLV